MPSLTMIGASLPDNGSKMNPYQQFWLRTAPTALLLRTSEADEEVT